MVALGLLLSRRNEAVSNGIKRGFPLPRIAHDLSRGLQSGIAQSRILSRSAGITRATQELEDIGVPLGLPGSIVTNVRRDIERAHRYGDSYATRWLKKAEGDTVAQAAKVASKDTLGSLNRIAVTESAEAYGEGRQKAVEALPLYEGSAARGGHVETVRSLLKVWDAQLDACPICKLADGTIVGIKENFPQGVPGAVHPHCLCTWSVLTFDERGTDGYIEPKEPAKVISLPVAAREVEPLHKNPQVAQLLSEGFTGAVPQSGLRPESFAHLRAGGAVYGGIPTLRIRNDGFVNIVDGRHRITIARERGDASMQFRVLVEGQRGAVKLDEKLTVELGQSGSGHQQLAPANRKRK